MNENHLFENFICFYFINPPSLVWYFEGDAKCRINLGQPHMCYVRKKMPKSLVFLTETSAIYIHVHHAGSICCNGAVPEKLTNSSSFS